MPILCLLLSSSASSGYSFLEGGTEAIRASLMSLKKKDPKKAFGDHCTNKEIIVSYRFVPLFCGTTLKHCKHHFHRAQPNTSDSRKLIRKALAFNQTWNFPGCIPFSGTAIKPDVSTAENRFLSKSCISGLQYVYLSLSNHKDDWIIVHILEINSKVLLCHQKSFKDSKVNYY